LTGGRCWKSLRGKYLKRNICTPDFHWNSNISRGDGTSVFHNLSRSYYSPKYPLKLIYNNPNLLHFTYDFLPQLIPHCSKIKPYTPCNPFIPSVLFWKKCTITMTQCCLFKNITRKKTKIKPWSRNLNKKWQTNE
jgi:hypothetical protein